MRPRWEIRETDANSMLPGQFYVALVAANNEVLSTSELFPDRDTAQDNVDAQRRAALIATVTRLRRRS